MGAITNLSVLGACISGDTAGGFLSWWIFRNELMNEITVNDIELGQMMFGNPVGTHSCPDYVEALIASIFSEIERVCWNRNQAVWNRYEDPILKGIEYRPYYWGEDEKEANLPNFSCKGVELRWYKHFGRSMSLNCEKSPAEWVEWFDNCMACMR